MLSAIKQYLILPSEITSFENRYLARMNRIGVLFFLSHVPLLTLLAWANGTGTAMALVLTSLTMFGPLLACRTSSNPRTISVVLGVTAIFMGGLLCHFGQGPVQIEMHFYFFVLLALLAVFANPLVIISAAVTVALHHLMLWVILPTSVFNYDAPIWVVGVHALFVVLESVAACFIARSFFDNVIGLERKVQDRTVELENRNDAMRRILNTVEEGLFTIDLTGRVGDEISAAAEKLLGTIPESRLLTDWLNKNDRDAADWLEVGLDEVFAGIMPLEITLEQLPGRCRSGRKSLSIAYSPLEECNQLTGLAVVVRDISATVAREELEIENREMMAIFDRISTDRAGFLEFFEEADELVQGLKSENRSDTTLTKRNLHTLKGNSSIFGLERIARTCHAIETALEDESEPVNNALWTELFGGWATVRGNLRKLITENEHTVGLSADQFQTLLMGILHDAPKQHLAPLLASWRLEPTRLRLTRIADQAKRLALRLGKGHINVKIQDNGLRTDAEHWAKFWSVIVHVVRNAVDHGLESPEERKLAGKSEVGTLTLRTDIDEARFIISVSDDGRGLNWDRLRLAAQRVGLPSESESDLIQALFVDGLSTSDKATDISGRGIGMSVVQSVCESMHGKLQVKSTKNVATEFSFIFDTRLIAPRLHDLLSDFGVDQRVYSLPNNQVYPLQGDS